MRGGGAMHAIPRESNTPQAAHRPMGDGMITKIRDQPPGQQQSRLCWPCCLSGPHYQAQAGQKPTELDDITHRDREHKPGLNARTFAGNDLHQVTSLYHCQKYFPRKLPTRVQYKNSYSINCTQTARSTKPPVDYPTPAIVAFSPIMATISQNIIPLEEVWLLVN